MKERKVLSVRGEKSKRTKIISVFQENELRIKIFRNPEQNYVGEVLLKWFKQERSDKISARGPLLITTFFFLNFNFKLTL